MLVFRLSPSTEEATLRVLGPLCDLPIRYRLLLSYSIVFIVAIMRGSVTIHSRVSRTIEANIESELNHSTESILNMGRTSVTLSIQNYLRAVAEKNREIAMQLHRR
jgi:two-component system, NtrC family, sensor kinase